MERADTSSAPQRFGSSLERNAALCELVRGLHKTEGFVPVREAAPTTALRCDPADWVSPKNRHDGWRRLGPHRHTDAEGFLWETPHDDRGFRHGVQRIFGADGTLASETGWEPAPGHAEPRYGMGSGATHHTGHSVSYSDWSRRTGPLRRYDTQGVLTYAVDHLEGFDDGLSKTFDEGVLTCISFLRVGALDGVNFTWSHEEKQWHVEEFARCLKVDPAAWKRLAGELVAKRKKLKRQEKYDEFAEGALLDAVNADRDDRVRLAWRLIEEKHVAPWGLIPLELLIEPLGSTPEALAMVLAAIPPEQLSETLWEHRLHRLVRFHAQTLEVSTLPAHAQPEVALAMGRPAVFTDEALTRLIERFFERSTLQRPEVEHGLLSWKDESLETMPLEASVLANAAEPKRLRRAIVEVALRRREQYRLEPTRFLADASMTAASSDELLRLLDENGFRENFALMSARSDGQGDLLALAKRGTPHQAQVMAVVAGLRCKATNEALNEGFDRFFADTKYHGDAYFLMSLRYAALDALSVVPPARAQVVVKAGLEKLVADADAIDSYNDAIAQAGVVHTPELLKVVKTIADRWAPRPESQDRTTAMQQLAFFGGAGPVDRLDTLARWHDDAPTEHRAFFSEAIRGALVHCVDRQRPFEARHDRFIEHVGTHDQKHGSKKVVTSLSPERLHALLERKLRPEVLPSLQAYELMPKDAPEALLHRAFDLLVEHLDRLPTTDEARAIAHTIAECSTERTTPFIIDSLERTGHDAKLAKLFDLEHFADFEPALKPHAKRVTEAAKAKAKAKPPKPAPAPAPMAPTPASSPAVQAFDTQFNAAKQSQLEARRLLNACKTLEALEALVQKEIAAGRVSTLPWLQWISRGPQNKATGLFSAQKHWTAEPTRGGTPEADPEKQSRLFSLFRTLIEHGVDPTVENGDDLRGLDGLAELARLEELTAEQRATLITLAASRGADVGRRRVVPRTGASGFFTSSALDVALSSGEPALEQAVVALATPEALHDAWASRLINNRRGGETFDRCLAHAGDLNRSMHLLDEGRSGGLVHFLCDLDVPDAVLAQVADRLELGRPLAEPFTLSVHVRSGIIPQLELDVGATAVDLLEAAIRDLEAQSAVGPPLDDYDRRRVDTNLGFARAKLALLTARGIRSARPYVKPVAPRVESMLVQLERLSGWLGENPAWLRTTLAGIDTGGSGAWTCLSALLKQHPERLFTPKLAKASPLLARMFGAHLPPSKVDPSLAEYALDGGWVDRPRLDRLPTKLRAMVEFAYSLYRHDDGEHLLVRAGDQVEIWRSNDGEVVRLASSIAEYLQQAIDPMLAGEQAPEPDTTRIEVEDASSRLLTLDELDFDAMAQAFKEGVEGAEEMEAGDVDPLIDDAQVLRAVVAGDLTEWPNDPPQSLLCLLNIAETEAPAHDEEDDDAHDSDDEGSHEDLDDDDEVSEPAAERHAGPENDPAAFLGNGNLGNVLGTWNSRGEAQYVRFDDGGYLATISLVNEQADEDEPSDGDLVDLIVVCCRVDGAWALAVLREDAQDVVCRMLQLAKWPELPERVNVWYGE